MPLAWQIAPNIKCNWRQQDAIDANLQLREVEDSKGPLPAQHAKVRICAAALNARDIMVISRDTAAYPIETAADLVPCLDGAGVVDEVGANSKWKVGDKVLFRPMTWHVGAPVPDLVSSKGLGAGDIQGTLRQVASVDDEGLFKGPANLSFEEMASFVTVGGTATNALFYGPEPVKAGMTVLTQGTGGVSVAAIQLALAVGATVIATSSSDTKLAQLKKLGVTHTINYKTHPNWSAEVLKFTNGIGVDHVVEVGGIGTIEESLKSTKRGGLISLIGFLAEGGHEGLAQVILMDLLFGAKTIRAVFDFRDDMLDYMVKLVDEHHIKPCISKTFNLKEAKEAFKYLQSQTGVGKVVVKTQ